MPHRAEEPQKRSKTTDYLQGLSPLATDLVAAQARQLFAQAGFWQFRPLMTADRQCEKLRTRDCCRARRASASSVRPS